MSRIIYFYDSKGKEKREILLERALAGGFNRYHTATTKITSMPRELVG
jgi:hypothetical protein